MLLDLNKNFLNLNGEEVPDNTMGKMLAQSLASIKGDLEPLKAMEWAFPLNKNESIQIDSVDLDKLYKYVEKLTNITPLAIAQLLKEIKAAMESK